MKKPLFFILFILLLPYASGCSRKERLPRTVRARALPTETKKQEAAKAALDWLRAVDRGKYDRAWSEAAEYLRRAVDRDQWQRQMNAVRAPLGSLVSREILSSMYYSELPGAPDGEYVVIQFSAVFSSKKNAVETLTPVLEKDGRWRVTGYYIK